MLLAALCLSYYFAAGLAINLGYHRALAHRSLVLPKWLERTLVTLGLPAGTPTQWAGNHRFHHAHADTSLDPHSPIHGYWHAHNGWYINRKTALPCLLYAVAGPLRILFDGWNRPRTNQSHNHLAPEVQADPYYRLLSRPTPFAIMSLVHVAVFFGGPWLAFGWQGLAALWLTSVIVFNLGDGIDSMAHLVGEAPYPMVDRARNHWFLGIFTFGEGWHANHHRFPWSARHGYGALQPDWTWMVIRALMWAKLARNVRVTSMQDLLSARTQPSGESTAQ